MGKGRAKGGRKGGRRRQQPRQTPDDIARKLVETPVKDREKQPEAEPLQIILDTDDRDTILDDLAGTWVHNTVRQGDSYDLSEGSCHMVLKTKPGGAHKYVPEMKYQSTDPMRAVSITFPEESVISYNTEMLKHQTNTNPVLNDMGEGVIALNDVFFPSNTTEDYIVDPSKAIPLIQTIRGMGELVIPAGETQLRLGNAINAMTSEGIPFQQVDAVVNSISNRARAAIKLQAALHNAATFYEDTGDNTIIAQHQPFYDEAYTDVEATMGKPIADQLRTEVADIVSKAGEQPPMEGRELLFRFNLISTGCFLHAGNMGEAEALKLVGGKGSENTRHATELYSAAVLHTDVKNLHDGLNELDQAFDSEGDANFRGAKVADLFGMFNKVLYGYRGFRIWRGILDTEKAIGESRCTLEGDYDGRPINDVRVRTPEGQGMNVRKLATETFHVGGYVEMVSKEQMPGGMFLAIDECGKATPIPTQRFNSQSQTTYWPEALVEHLMDDKSNSVREVLLVQGRKANMPYWLSLYHIMGIETIIKNTTGRDVPVNLVAAEMLRDNDGKITGTKMHAHCKCKTQDDLFASLNKFGSDKRVFQESADKVLQEVSELGRESEDAMDDDLDMKDRIKIRRQYRQKMVKAYYDHFTKAFTEYFDGQVPTELSQYLLREYSATDRLINRQYQWSNMSDRFASKHRALKAFKKEGVTSEDEQRLVVDVQRDISIEVQESMNNFLDNVRDRFCGELYKKYCLDTGVSELRPVNVTDNWGVSMGLPFKQSDRAEDDQARQDKFMAVGISQTPNTSKVIRECGNLGFAAAPLKPLLDAYARIPKKQYNSRVSELSAVRKAVETDEQVSAELTDIGDCTKYMPLVGTDDRARTNVLTSMIVLDSLLDSPEKREEIGRSMCSQAGLEYDALSNQVGEITSSCNGLPASLHTYKNQVMLSRLQARADPIIRNAVPGLHKEALAKGEDPEEMVGTMTRNLMHHALERRAREMGVRKNQVSRIVSMLSSTGLEGAQDALTDLAEPDVGEAPVATGPAETSPPTIDPDQVEALVKIQVGSTSSTAQPAEPEIPLPANLWGLGDDEYRAVYTQAEAAGITVNGSPDEGLNVTSDGLAYIAGRRKVEAGLCDTPLTMWVEELPKGKAQVADNVGKRLEAEKAAKRQAEERRQAIENLRQMAEGVPEVLRTPMPVTTEMPDVRQVLGVSDLTRVLSHVPTSLEDAQRYGQVIREREEAGDHEAVTQMINVVEQDSRMIPQMQAEFPDEVPHMQARLSATLENYVGSDDPQWQAEAGLQSHISLARSVALERELIPDFNEYCQIFGIAESPDDEHAVVRRLDLSSIREISNTHEMDAMHLVGEFSHLREENIPITPGGYFNALNVLLPKLQQEGIPYNGFQFESVSQPVSFNEVDGCIILDEESMTEATDESLMSLAQGFTPQLTPGERQVSGIYNAINLFESRGLSRQSLTQTVDATHSFLQHELDNPKFSITIGEHDTDTNPDPLFVGQYDDNIYLCIDPRTDRGVGVEVLNANTVERYIRDKQQ